MRIIRKIWNSPTFMTWGNMLSSSGKLLVLTPLILVKFNSDETAFWYLLLTINSMVIVVDFGFYPTFSRVISYVFNGLDRISDISKKTRIIEGDRPAWGFMKNVYGTLNTVYVSLCFLVFFVILVASYSPVSTIINRTGNQLELWYSYGFFLLSIALNLFAKRSDSIIIGTNHVAMINRWNILNNISNSVSSIIIVLYDLGVIWLAVNQLAFAIILVFRNIYIERNICEKKFKKFKFINFNKELFLWIWNPSWRSGILILASTGLTQITGFVYTNLSTSAQLASYLITLKLVTTISQFSQAPFYSKLPIFSGLRVKNHLTCLSEKTIVAIRKSLMVFVVGIMFLIYLGDYLLEFIGSKTRLESPEFIILMAFVWFFERHHAMHAQIFVTTNRIPFYKTAIISGVVNICFMLFLIPKVGSWAFPISLGISNLIINNWWNVKISLKSIESDFFPYFRKSALLPFFILLFLAVIKVLF